MEQFGVNANMLRVGGEFTIQLSDFGIEVQAILRLKVSNQIKIRVDLTAFETASAAQ